jgi:hypothetical protein
LTGVPVAVAAGGVGVGPVPEGMGVGVGPVPEGMGVGVGPVPEGMGVGPVPEGVGVGPVPEGVGVGPVMVGVGVSVGHGSPLSPSQQYGSTQTVFSSLQPPQGTQVLPFGLTKDPQSIVSSFGVSLNSSHPHSS